MACPTANKPQRAHEQTEASGDDLGPLLGCRDKLFDHPLGVLRRDGILVHPLGQLGDASNLFLVLINHLDQVEDEGVELGLWDGRNAVKATDVDDATKAVLKEFRRVQQGSIEDLLAGVIRDQRVVDDLPDQDRPCVLHWDHALGVILPVERVGNW